MSERQTIFSEDRLYRYTLWREWCIDSVSGCSDDLINSDKAVQFLCLNPSTADETKDDNTVRRCIDYAKRWGFGAFCMTNIFAWRSTDPKILPGLKNPIGDGNDEWILKIARQCSLTVAGWGKDGALHNRGLKVRWLFRDAGIQLHCLKITNDGQPNHPLYLPADLKPILL